MRDRHIVVTLIHGTWAQNAPWTRPGSYFQKTLEENLRSRGASSVTFLPFTWNASNSHEGRLEAGKLLQDRIRWWIQGYPDAMHFVVAHSHGGNVALHALLRSAPIRERLDGLICIATPFLHFEKRDVGWLILPTILNSVGSFPMDDDARGIIFEGGMYIWMLFSFGLACLGLPFVLIGYAIAPDMIAKQLGGSACQTFLTFDACNFKTIGGLALFIAVFFMHYLRLSRREVLARLQKTLPTIRHLAAEWYYYFQPKTRFRTLRVLAMSSAIDEAFVGLTGSWWAHRASGWIGGAVILALLVALYIGIVLGFAWLIFKLGFVARALPIGILIVALMITLPLTLIGLSKVARLLRYLSLGIGPGLLMDHGLMNYCFRVKAMRDPGLPRSQHKRYTVRDLIFSKGFLFHSRIYANNVAIEDMAAWMETVGPSGDDISEQPRLLPDEAVPVTSKDDERDQQP